MMDFLENLDLLSVAVAIAGIITMGFAVFFNNKKSITNKTFLLFTISAAVWGIFNYINYQFASEIIVLWLLRFVIFFAVWYTFFLFQLFYVFPEENKVFPNIYKFLLIPLVIITSLINLSPLVFSGIAELAPAGQVSKTVVKPGIYLFAGVVLFLIISAFFILIKKIIRTEKIARKSFSLMLWGVIITFILHIIFNLILPGIFLDIRFIPLGAMFTFPFVAFTSYAILRHKLFNINVAGTAVLVFLLSVVTFFEVIFAGSLSLIVYRSSIFLLVLSFGIMLIRGVLREVEQREKLAELNRQLQVANVELDKLSKAKSEFISIASHQLRTPLTAIKGYISMIIEGSYGKFAEKAKKPLENVYKANERLVNLVNDLLSISRIESGKMKFEPEPASIEEIIEDVIFDLRINAEKKNLYLNFEKHATPLPNIQLDKTKTRDIILNLVDNAIKYANDGGIAIKLKIQNSNLKIEIKDTGEGMEKYEIEKIFESFSRGTVGVKAFTEGAGLGLYIARKYAEMHGGRVWAESYGKGKGSTFIVEIPAR